MNVEERDTESTPAAAAGDPLVGAVVAGRYRVHAPLGRAGVGRLYRASMEPVGRVVALRVLPAGRPDPDADDRFAREASIAGRLTHPNSVRLIDFGRTEQGGQCPHQNGAGAEAFEFEAEPGEGGGGGNQPGAVRGRGQWHQCPPPHPADQERRGHPHSS